MDEARLTKAQKEYLSAGAKRCTSLALAWLLLCLPFVGVGTFTALVGYAWVFIAMALFAALFVLAAILLFARGRRMARDAEGGIALRYETEVLSADSVDKKGRPAPRISAADISFSTSEALLPALKAGTKITVVQAPESLELLSAKSAEGEELLNPPIR
jgi:hypothetical protein